MKRPQGKLTLGLVAVLLLIGAMLLRQHLTQSESPKVNENQAPNSLNASSAASTAGTRAIAHLRNRRWINTQ